MSEPMGQPMAQLQPVVRLPAAVKPAAVLPEAPPGEGIQPLPPEVRPSIEGALDLTKLRKAGRPAGAKDRYSRRERQFLKLTFWFKELKKDWIKIEPYQRARLCYDFIHLLIDKAKNLPQNPNDSKKSAKDIMQALQELEGISSTESENCDKSIAFQHNTTQDIPVLRDVKTDSTLNQNITQSNPIVNTDMNRL